MATLVARHDSDSYNNFISAISDRPEAFLHPTDALNAAALVVSKRLIDPLASSNSVFDQLYTDGLHVDQIWEQLKTITENIVEDILIMDLPAPDEVNETQPETYEEKMYFDSGSDVESHEFVRQLEEEEGEEEDSLDAISEDESDEEDDDSQQDLANASEDLDEDDEDVRDISGYLDDNDDNNEANLAENDNAGRSINGNTLSNDQFFDPEEFSKQMDLMDANYEQEQSADDIDYNADPEQLTDEDDLGDELGNEGINANDLRYDDFFAPPKRRGTSLPKKRKRAHFEEETYSDDEAAADNGITAYDDESSVGNENEEGTISRMQKDLFADDDAATQDASLEAGPKLSAHAKRQLRLAEEIRQLENDNVAKKDWTLMGEASAKARPKDSLLEEGLDFERTSRPVPIVTEEVTQTLEDMIKARIVEGRFDTVLRKIPEAAHKFSKKSFELDENKPSQSLAEVYETEFQKQQNPGEFKSAADKKLEAEHKEIEKLFQDLCYNLDALSSWHYTPKPATESLNIVSNAAAIEMEDAQPMTMSSASRLAPQEQFKTALKKGEVAGKSGLPIAKAEMTSEERQRHRRKQRAVAKKSGVQKKVQIASMSKAKQEQAGVIDTLKKANVKVIRNGKTRDLNSGVDYNSKAAALKPSNLKL